VWVAFALCSEVPVILIVLASMRTPPGDADSFEPPHSKVTCELEDGDDLLLVSTAKGVTATKRIPCAP
jgi:hypothetical protein